MQIHSTLILLGKEEIKEFCRGKIAHYKIPRYVKFVETLPMTVTGKIQISSCASNR